MNILITGAKGQLGTEIAKLIPNAILTSHQDLDITNFDSVRDFTKKNHINTIVNCAAYTAVDAAEDDYLTAKQINSIGPQNLANTCCKIVQISTDYVFDGCAKKPYNTEAYPEPCSIYGWTKLLGERAVMKNATEYAIIRTSWLYSPFGKNFVKTMRNLGTTRESINVVDDQIGSPTYAADLAGAIAEIIPQMNTSNRGVYHYCNTGQCSWYDFACEIMAKSGLKCKVLPTTSTEYKTKAIRPKYSVLDTTKIQNVFGIKIDNWQNALARCINEIESQQK